MSLEQSLKYYRMMDGKSKDFIGLSKAVLRYMPLFLRLPERNKRMMVLLFIALQVLTLMEFVVRRELAENRRN